MLHAKARAPKPVIKASALIHSSQFSWGWPQTVNHEATLGPFGFSGSGCKAFAAVTCAKRPVAPGRAAGHVFISKYQ